MMYGPAYERGLIKMRRAMLFIECTDLNDTTTLLRRLTKMQEALNETYQATQLPYNYVEPDQANTESTNTGLIAPEMA